MTTGRINQVCMHYSTCWITCKCSAPSCCCAIFEKHTFYRVFCNEQPTQCVASLWMCSTQTLPLMITNAAQDPENGTRSAHLSECHCTTANPLLNVAWAHRHLRHVRRTQCVTIALLCASMSNVRWCWLQMLPWGPSVTSHVCTQRKNGENSLPPTCLRCR